MGKGLGKAGLQKLAEGGILRGHANDNGNIIDPGHDLHGNGKGLGHTKNGGRLVEKDVAEDQTFVYDFDHSFRSGVADQGVSYSVDGDDADLFTIDPATGQLSFAEAVDFEIPSDSDADGVYEVVVTTTVTGKPAGSVETAVRVTVTDVDEPEEAQNAQPSLTVLDQVAPITNEMGNSAVATLLAFDPNVEDTLQFTLTGDDAAAFRIEADPADTDLSDGIDMLLIVRPEFITVKEDAGPDGIFNVTVTVTDDDGAFDEQPLSFALEILSA